MSGSCQISQINAGGPWEWICPADSEAAPAGLGANMVANAVATSKNMAGRATAQAGEALEAVGWKSASANTNAGANAIRLIEEPLAQAGGKLSRGTLVLAEKYGLRWLVPRAGEQLGLTVLKWTGAAAVGATAGLAITVTTAVLQELGSCGTEGGPRCADEPAKALDATQDDLKTDGSPSSRVQGAPATAPAISEQGEACTGPKLLEAMSSLKRHHDQPENDIHAPDAAASEAADMSSQLEELLMLPPANQGTLRNQIKLMHMRRAEYVRDVNQLRIFAAEMEAEGVEPECIARVVHAERRLLGEKYKELTPTGKLIEIYLRNLLRYGDTRGPSIEWLRLQGKTWAEIIASAMRSGGGDLGF